MSGKHNDKWLTNGGLGGHAYAELRVDRADWPEWIEPVKSPIWTDEACVGLRSRLQNLAGEAAVKLSAKTATTGELVYVEMWFSHWKKVGGRRTHYWVGSGSTWHLVPACGGHEGGYSQLPGHPQHCQWWHTHYSTWARFYHSRLD